MSYADRYRRRARQAGYRRAVRTRGLAALLEPYTLRTPTIPAQRTGSPGTPSSPTVSKQRRPVD